jgi:hypothetical protein
VPFCGGPLHHASYCRKPRGGPCEGGEAYGVRLSLCCGRSGCRRRVLPPSVLFWGRRVYWAAVFLVVVALRQGRTRGYTAEKLKALFGVTRPTLARWMRYFRQVFPHSQAWRRLSGRLLPPLPQEQLPGGLLARFFQARGNPDDGLICCLRALADEG